MLKAELWIELWIELCEEKFFGPQAFDGVAQLRRV
jgi:hypothetical protein